MKKLFSKILNWFGSNKNWAFRPMTRKEIKAALPSISGKEREEIRKICNGLLKKWGREYERENNGV